MTSLNQSDIMSSAPNAHPMSIIARTDVSNPSTEDWVNVFGPSGYNVQPDTTRNRKMGRVHLPDVLKVISQRGEREREGEWCQSCRVFLCSS